MDSVEEIKPEIKLTEAEIREDLKLIANFQDKNTILSWRRRLKKMNELIEQLEPIQAQILKLIEAKQPISDEIETLRQDMVKTCIHPENLLQHKGSFVECKFCNARIVINRPTKSQP
jgi:hypothetical protein